jgi:ATP-binding cassette subfamily B protein/subfamily B ATP-binding cassette protein MsbA
VGSQVRVALTGGLSTLASGLVGTIGIAIVLVVGAHQALAGHVTIGALIVFVAYVTTLQEQFAGLTGIYPNLQAARASIDRVVEVLDARADVVDRPGAVVLGRARGEVRFDDVSFGYEPRRPVLRSVSFAAGPGEVVAVVGPTGAGKSTLAGLVPRFFDPDQGRVLLDGHDLRELALASVRASVALVLQESFLFPFSIAENIAYGRPGAGRAEIEAAARAANAHEFVSRLPDGYETVVGERGATLSGGERQRIAIARALLKDAPLLVLDEPTSALDAETEQSLLEALDRLMAGRTTLVIAHRLSTIRRADQILVLRDGQITERGNHQQLLALDGTYAHMHQIQHDVQEG